jgi:hypothetical protein
LPYTEPDLNGEGSAVICGDPSVFAIESGITEGFDRLSFRGLGFFNIHAAGRRYGVYKPDATMLACPFDSVQRRIAGRGKHTAPFALASDAGEIADNFRNAIYSENQHENFFGISCTEFSRFFSKDRNDCQWAPDGDKAFDDGSCVLQFDVKDRVRLIAFKSDDDYSYDPNTLSDVWLAVEEFYGILKQWRDTFESEWISTPKSVPRT